MRLLFLTMFASLALGSAQAKTVVRIVPIGLSTQDSETITKQAMDRFEINYYAYDFAPVRNPLVSADPVTGILAREVSIGQLAEIIIDVDGQVPDWARGSSIKEALWDRLGDRAIVHLEEAEWYGTVDEEERRDRMLRSGQRLIHASISPNPDGTIDLDVQAWRTASSEPQSIVVSQLAPRGEQYKYEDCTPATFSTIQKGRAPIDLIACVHHRVGVDKAGSAQLVLKTSDGTRKPMGSLSKSAIASAIATEAKRINGSTGGTSSPSSRDLPGIYEINDMEPDRLGTNRSSSTSNKPAVIPYFLFGAQVGLPLIIGGSGLEIGQFRKRAKISAIGLRTEFNASTTTVDGTIGGIPLLLFGQLGDITNAPLVVGEGMVGFRYGGPDQGWRPQAGIGLRFPELFPGLFFTEDSGQGGPELFVRGSVFSYSKYVYDEYWDDEYGYVQSNSGETQLWITPFIQIGIGWRWGLY